jgi:hypothetical protein
MSRILSAAVSTPGVITKFVGTGRRSTFLGRWADSLVAVEPCCMPHGKAAIRARG